MCSALCEISQAKTVDEVIALLVKYGYINEKGISEPFQASKKVFEDWEEISEKDGKQSLACC